MCRSRCLPIFIHQSNSVFYGFETLWNVILAKEGEGVFQPLGSGQGHLDQITCWEQLAWLWTSGPEPMPICRHTFPGHFLENIGANITLRENLLHPFIPFDAWGRLSPREGDSFGKRHPAEEKTEAQILCFPISVRLHFIYKEKTDYLKF